MPINVVTKAVTGDLEALIKELDKLRRDVDVLERRAAHQQDEIDELKKGGINKT